MRLVFFFLLVLCSFPLSAQVQTGIASFYANKFEGRLTASGEKYSQSRYTAAHRTLPFGTRVKVTNMDNKRSVIVKINDRGPFVKGRIIDLSRAAAKKLDFIDQGTARVKIEPIEAEKAKKIGATPLITAKRRQNSKFYNLKKAEISPTGFGVQVGSFHEMENLREAARKLERKYHQAAIIQNKTIDGATIYALIAGTFKTKEKAIAFKKKIRKHYPDSFLITF